ncbi:MAG TPA: hypothetical protein PKI20_00775 [Verrucomicrobiota bacterium]|nr:hypothetical protein [Verrucomicrobiota bacterium]HQL76632.1 hypothetical protein [Verrucomicrobiota bacterium]
MTHTEIIETLRARLSIPGGRHLYGVLGPYRLLNAFANQLAKAKASDGTPFPKAISVNRGILDTIPDDDFRQLVNDEAKRPEPTAAHVAAAFEQFVRSQLAGKSLVVLRDFELVFAYHLELNLLRTLAADQDRLLLLLPGRRERGATLLFPDSDHGSYTLPTNLIAENNLWELKN